MSGRDFAGREKKKPKKDNKKKPIVSSTFEAPRTDVEIIRKGKKPRDTEGEE